MKFLVEQTILCTAHYIVEALYEGAAEEYAYKLELDKFFEFVDDTRMISTTVDEMPPDGTEQTKPSGPINKYDKLKEMLE